MAFIQILSLPQKLIALSLSRQRISGTVADSTGAFVRAEVIIIKRGVDSIVARTFSDSITGAWSVEVTGGANDRFSAVAFGDINNADAVAGSVLGILQ